MIYIVLIVSGPSSRLNAMATSSFLIKKIEAPRVDITTFLVGVLINLFPRVVEPWELGNHLGRISNFCDFRLHSNFRPIQGV